MRNEIILSILAMVTVQIFTAKATVQADTTAEDLLPSSSKQQQLLTRHTKAAEDPRSVSPNDVLCPDGRTRCTTGQTCCPYILGGYGCCNYLGAACCSNHMTCCSIGTACCSNGYTCCPIGRECCSNGLTCCPFGFRCSGALCVKA